MDPGSSILVRLYNRNDMSNITIDRLYLEIPPVEGFSFTFEPDHLESIEAGDYKYFDINLTASNDLAYGDYEVTFLLGDMDVGAYHEVILIRIRPYGSEMQYFLGGAVILILGFAVYKFIWIKKVNNTIRKTKNKSKKKSFYYYKD